MESIHTGLEALLCLEFGFMGPLWSQHMARSDWLNSMMSLELAISQYTVRLIISTQKKQLPPNCQEQLFDVTEKHS